MLACSLAIDLRPPPGTQPSAGHYDRMIELVREAERLRYTTVWATEQHGVDDGYLPAPLIALSALARETSSIRLGTGVVLLTLARPRRVVEEAGVVDVLSNGRLTLGFGAGHHEHEFRLFGRNLTDRAALMEDGLTYVRRALSEPVAPDGMPINVPPVQQPVPVVVGGLAAPAVDRAVRLADGHFSYSFFDPDADLVRLWHDRLAPSLERHERTPGAFKLIVSSLIWPSDTFEDDWRDHVGPAFRYQQRRYYEWAGASEDDLPELLRRPTWDLGEVRERLFVGPPREIAERLAAIRRVYPYDEIVLSPALPGVPLDLAEHCLRTFATEVVPAVRAVTEELHA